MQPLTPGNSMMEALEYIQKDKSAGGNYIQKIKEITSFIDSIEAGNEKVHKTFGKNLVPLYCMRAKAHYEKGAKTNDLAELELARKDVRRAVEMTQAFYPYMEANALAEVHQGIYNTISTDDHQRQEAMNVIVHLTGEVSFAQAERVVPQASQATDFLTHLYRALIGTGLWLLAVGAAYIGGSLGLVIGGLFALFLLYLSCIWGWSWLSNPPEHRGWYLAAKVAVFLVVVCTIIGLLPMIYWTGKGAMLWYQNTFR